MRTWRQKLPWLLAALIAAAVAWFLREALSPGAPRKTAVLALLADEAGLACARSGYPLGDFLERAKTIGAQAVVLREQNISELAAFGDVLTFDKNEVGKWKALGLLAPGAPLRADSLWIKNPAVFSRALESAARLGLTIATAAAAGYHVVEAPGGFPNPFSVGVDPDSLREVQRAGLHPLVGADRPISPSMVGLSPGAPAGLPPRQAGNRFVLRGRVLEARELAVGMSAAEGLRAAYGGAERLLVWRLAADAGIEENLDRLREFARELKNRGVSLEARGASAFAGSAESVPASPSRLARTLAWAVLIVGPLLSARAGLRALRVAKGFARQRAPQASPVLELLCGAFATAAAAAVLGLMLGVCGGMPWEPPGPARAMAAPLMLGFFALYAADLPAWARRLRSKVAYGDVLGFLALAALAVVVLNPGWILDRSAWPGFACSWWWPWRWREALIGFPCLLAAHEKLSRKWDCPDCDDGDPRPGLLLGLLGPIGVIVAGANLGVPPLTSLGHTAAVLAAGVVIGGAGIGLGYFIPFRPKLK